MGKATYPGAQGDTDLSGSQDDGGDLGAVAPLRQEGEGERLDEDAGEEGVEDPSLRGADHSRLHILSLCLVTQGQQLNGDNHINTLTTCTSHTTNQA